MMDFNEDRVTQICSNSIIFKNLEKDAIKKFLSSLAYKVVFIKKGEMIIKEDDHIDYLGVILEGEVNVCKYCPDGSESLLTKLQTHEVFALDILGTPSQNSFYNVYTTKPSFILKIDKKILEKAIILSERDSCNMYENIITCLANTCAKKCHKIELVSQRSIRDKIMTYLLIQKNNKNSNKFRISFDRDQLANYLCVNRSVLSHELSLMQKEGIIKFRKNEFEILK
ncbi:Crp/Fnr family transcriptional regulator [Terrisporobacter petrolearius]|uniref:Crp/Fnr family transcriptional regulator n=1 Tax=Terrisporobacter petrolearius TaxID=1460447 RepID=UPI001D16DF1D|nr:Crp/Fnr family transcriptional regulator [Terrisporobacter petrolearius]MCC3862776.1 Crp/Fnr family transcriptional regulator [Terrisporobacter petrolearius]